MRLFLVLNDRKSIIIHASLPSREFEPVTHPLVLNVPPPDHRLPSKATYATSTTYIIMETYTYDGQCYQILKPERIVVQGTSIELETGRSLFLTFLLIVLSPPPARALNSITG